MRLHVWVTAIAISTLTAYAQAPQRATLRDGETALRQALAGLKARGAVVLMAAHRSSVVGVADRVIVLDDGRMVQMGPASEILARLGAAQIRQVAP